MDKRNTRGGRQFSIDIHQAGGMHARRRSNKLSPEEQQRVRSIQGDPGKDATTKVSIDPERESEDIPNPPEEPGDKPAARPGE